VSDVRTKSCFEWHSAAIRARVRVGGSVVATAAVQALAREPARAGGVRELLVDARMLDATTVLVPYLCASRQTLVITPNPDALADLFLGVKGPCGDEAALWAERGRFTESRVARTRLGPYIQELKANRTDGSVYVWPQSELLIVSSRVMCGKGANAIALNRIDTSRVDLVLVHGTARLARTKGAALLAFCEARRIRSLFVIADGRSGRVAATGGGVGGAEGPAGCDDE
jgi:hypothetical protein